MKRLVKIFGEQLRGEIPVDLPKEIPLNVTLVSGSTFLGKLLEQTRQVIQIEDSRFHIHNLAVPEIDIVVYDYISPY